MAAVSRDGKHTASIEGRMTGIESRLARLEEMIEDVATRRDVKSSKKSIVGWVVGAFVAALWFVAAVMGSFYVNS